MYAGLIRNFAGRLENEI